MSRVLKVTFLLHDDLNLDSANHESPSLLVGTLCNESGKRTIRKGSADKARDSGGKIISPRQAVVIPVATQNLYADSMVQSDVAEGFLETQWGEDHPLKASIDISALGCAEHAPGSCSYEGKKQNPVHFVVPTTAENDAGS